MNATRGLLELATRVLGGRGGDGGVDGRRTARPARGLNGAADALADDLLGEVDSALSDFRVSGFDKALGIGALLVVGAAFVIPALSKKWK